MPVIQDEIGLTLDRIVVATDFSPVSETALSYAGALARRFASALTLANVVDLSVAVRADTAVVGFPLEQMRRDSAENMDRALYGLSAAGLQAQGRTLEASNPAAAVVDLSDDLDADLLVVGTHARAGLSKMILGSCAEGVIHHAHCPVLTIGPNVKPVPVEGFAFRNIIFASDLRHDTVEKAAVALAFAKEGIAKVYLCHILEGAGKDISEAVELQIRSEETLGRLVPRALQEWCSPRCIVEYGASGEQILEIARRTHADLIVLGAKRSANWMTHLAAGTVGAVLAGATCPVMTICAG